MQDAAVVHVGRPLNNNEVCIWTVLAFRYEKQRRRPWRESEEGSQERGKQASRYQREIPFGSGDLI